MRVVGQPCGVKCNRVVQITFAIASALLAAALREVWWPMWRGLTWPGLLDLLELRVLVAHFNDDEVDENVNNNSQQPTRNHQELH